MLCKIDCACVWVCMLFLWKYLFSVWQERTEGRTGCKTVKRTDTQENKKKNGYTRACNYPKPLIIAHGESVGCAAVYPDLNKDE